VENLGKEDVTIVSDNLKLLTDGLFDNEKGTQATSTENQIDSTKKVEKEYEKKILNVLEPIYKDNVKVSVNAQLDFDAVKQNNVTYNPKESAVVSEHIIKDNSKGTENTSGSVVDNNMTNEQEAEKDTEKAGYSEETRNYNNTKIEETVVKAPGQVERITTSVVVNGDIDNATKNTIKNLVSDAIGFDEKRGDGISVESLAFNNDYKTQAEEEINAMKEAEAKSRMVKLIALGIGIVIAIILIIVFILILRGKRKEEEDEEAIEGLDVVVGDETLETVADLYKDLDLEAESEKEIIMKEVKKYAEKKPEQVADIIKSWMTEEEGR